MRHIGRERERESESVCVTDNLVCFYRTAKLMDFLRSLVSTLVLLCVN